MRCSRFVPALPEMVQRKAQQGQCHCADIVRCPNKQNGRIAFFLFLNFAMIAPMVQLFYQHGYEKGSKFVGQSSACAHSYDKSMLNLAAPFGLSVITYVIGLLFYAFHVPECFYPGKFDRWGHSHQVSLFGIMSNTN